MLQHGQVVQLRSCEQLPPILGPSGAQAPEPKLLGCVAAVQARPVKHSKCPCPKWLPTPNRFLSWGNRKWSSNSNHSPSCKWRSSRSCKWHSQLSRWCKHSNHHSQWCKCSSHHSPWCKCSSHHSRWCKCSSHHSRWCKCSNHRSRWCKHSNHSSRWCRCSRRNPYCNPCSRLCKQPSLPTSWKWHQPHMCNSLWFRSLCRCLWCNRCRLGCHKCKRKCKLCRYSPPKLCHRCNKHQLFINPCHQSNPYLVHIQVMTSCLV